MLRVTKLIGHKKDRAKYYCEKENYYYKQKDGVESVLEEDPAAHGHMRVHGGLAKALGYVPGQEISQDQFLNLLSGQDSQGRRVTREHKVLGFDLTFSAHKSVSIAALLTLKDRRIVEAHDRAVRETLAEFESHFVGTQPRAGEQVKTRNLVYGAVRDGFNRDHDPHLHTHVIVANMTRFNGKIMALDGQLFLTRDLPLMLGGIYRAKLATILSKELGYSLTYTKKGDWRMDAVAVELEENFSKRAQAIKVLMDEGFEHEQAFKRTRKAKNPRVSKAAEKERWAAEAARFRERTLEENREAALLLRQKWHEDARYSVEAKQELSGKRQTNETGRWQLAARRATDKGAVVTGEALITEYLKELGRTEKWEGVTYLELEHRLKAQVDAGHLIHTDDGRYTTWEMSRADREALLSRPAPAELVLSREAALREVEAYQTRKKDANLWVLSKEQAAAVVGILSAESGAVVVQGDAGAGKTTMLRAVEEVGARLGWEMGGTAVQGLASTKLETESGIASVTLTSYLAKERAAAKAREVGQAGGRRAPAPRPPRLVVIDEASMLGSRDVADLQTYALRNNDKLVFVGDRHQLRAVAAGMPFERLVQAAERSDELLVLKEIRRQVNPVLIQVADLARQGRMRECLGVLDQDNRIHEISDDQLRREAIAKRYDDQTLILTASNQSRVYLNEQIRERLMSEKVLDRATARDYQLMQLDSDGKTHKVRGEFVLGERVVFTVTEHKEIDVDNGNVGTLTRLGDKELDVRLEDGREITLDLKKYGYLDYGYALTTYKGQGQTYDKCVKEADMRLPHLHDRRSVYVWETRSRHESFIYTNDRGSLYEAAQVQSAKRDTLDLDFDLEKARQMERKLEEMAREAALAKSLSAEIAIPEVELVKSQEELAVKEPTAHEHAIEPAKKPELQVSIANDELTKAANGDAQSLKIAEDKCKEVARCIDADRDLNPKEKENLAKYFTKEEAAELIHWPEADAGMKVAAAKIASGLREGPEACQGFDFEKELQVRAYAQELETAREAREKELLLEKENKLKRSQGLEFYRSRERRRDGPELEL